MKSDISLAPETGVEEDGEGLPLGKYEVEGETVAEGEGVGDEGVGVDLGVAIGVGVGVGVLVCIGDQFAVAVLGLSIIMGFEGEESPEAPSLHLAKTYCETVVGLIVA